MKFIFLDAVTSTNDYAATLIERGEPTPFWVSAKSQTAGRGRRGRHWVSIAGNLYCTGVYPALKTPQVTGHLSFVAAIALIETLKDYVKADTLSIKWPNDVLIKGAKCAGILLEARKDKILIGVGVNLMSAPSDTPYPASSVIDHIPHDVLSNPEPKVPNPETVLAVFASRFDDWYKKLIVNGFSPIREKWLSHAAHIPGNVTVHLANESFTGESIGLGANGELQVRLLNGTMRNIHAGDVFFNLSKAE